MKARVLLVDDETLARERLRQLLRDEVDFEVIGECSDGRGAVEAIGREKPDVLFLDVQMPELNGFEVLEAVGDGVPRVVVFCTAYDQFAVKAFEVHAVDYLLKPFDRERFRMTLERVRQRCGVAERDGGGEGALASQLRGLLADMRVGGKPPERLAVKSSGRILLVKLEDIDWIESADNYVELHVGKETHLLRETMSTLEDRLGGGRFVRISRSTIVNVTRVKELQALFHGDYAVILEDGHRLTLSRNYREGLDYLIGR